MTTAKTTKRIEILERQASEAGLFDAKLDVTPYFQMIRKEYGLDDCIEPVLMRASSWANLSQMIEAVYGG